MGSVVETNESKLSLYKDTISQLTKMPRGPYLKLVTFSMNEFKEGDYDTATSLLRFAYDLFYEDMCKHIDRLKERYEAYTLRCGQYSTKITPEELGDSFFQKMYENDREITTVQYTEELEKFENIIPSFHKLVYTLLYR